MTRKIFYKLFVDPCIEHAGRTSCPSAVVHKLARNFCLTCQILDDLLQAVDANRPVTVPLRGSDFRSSKSILVEQRVLTVTWQEAYIFLKKLNNVPVGVGTAISLQNARLVIFGGQPALVCLAMRVLAKFQKLDPFLISFDVELGIEMGTSQLLVLVSPA